MDFGIARFVTENTVLTGSGDVLGTADYISPEQIHGITELDSRTDQYSFAVMTYQLLTGKKPFERNNTGNDPLAPRAAARPPHPCSHAGHLAEALSKHWRKPEERFRFGR
jgi:serine/threonine-protein kinase